MFLFLFFFNKCLPDNGRLNSKHLSTFTKVCHQLEAGAAPSQAANRLVCRTTPLLWAPSQSQAGPHCLCPLWPAAGIRTMILPAAVTVFPELCQDPSLSDAVTSREEVWDRQKNQKTSWTLRTDLRPDSCPGQVPTPAPSPSEAFPWNFWVGLDPGHKEHVSEAQ